MKSAFPHVRYADAVYADLAAADMRPPLLEVGVTDNGELTIRAAWPARHDDLAAEHWPRGMHLLWSHVSGWRVDDPDTGDGRMLRIPSLAAPAAVTASVYHLAEHGLLDADGRALPRSQERWDQAHTLDFDLSEWDAEDRW